MCTMIEVKQSDEALIDRYRREGDQRVMEAILRKYEYVVKSRVSPFFLIGADREDLLQEGRIGLYKAVRDFKPGITTFRAFAYLCIDRQILTAVKRATRQKHRALNYSVSIDQLTLDEDGRASAYDVVDTTVVDPPDEVARADMSRLLRDCIFRDLSHLETQVIEQYLLGMSYLDSSDKLQRGVKSIDNALQRAKRKISLAVAENYSLLSDQ
jgi:RNA polymerase sporulation-specific sigma factor